MCGWLENTSITDAVIAPEGRTTVSASLRWLPSDAYEVKAFFLKSLSSLESYRTVLGAKIYELPAGTSDGAEVQTIAASLNRRESVIPVYPGGKYKALTMRYDDGTANDRRLLEIFNRYGIRGTFYLIPTYLNRGGDSITDEEVPALYAGHEVGNHTYSHQRPSDLSVPALEQEVESGKIYLERITGETVRGFAYPYSEFGTDKEAFIQSLKNTGHTYAVTGTGSRTFELPDLSKPYEIPFTIRHRENLMDMAQQYLALAQKKRSLFFVMGHAHEFENENNWELIEEFSSVMSGKQDIWYATNGEVFGYLMAQERTAVPQTGSSLTTNHTAQTLWYQVGERLVEVRPGDTLKITGAEEAR